VLKMHRPDSVLAPTISLYSSEFCLRFKTASTSSNGTLPEVHPPVPIISVFLFPASRAALPYFPFPHYSALQGRPPSVNAPPSLFSWPNSSFTYQFPFFHYLPRAGSSVSCLLHNMAEPSPLACGSMYALYTLSPLRHSVYSPFF